MVFLDIYLEVVRFRGGSLVLYTYSVPPVWGILIRYCDHGSTHHMLSFLLFMGMKCDILSNNGTWSAMTHLFIISFILLWFPFVVFSAEMQLFFCAVCTHQRGGVCLLLLISGIAPVIEFKKWHHSDCGSSEGVSPGMEGRLSHTAGWKSCMKEQQDALVCSCTYAGVSWSPLSYATTLHTQSK